MKSRTAITKDGVTVTRGDIVFDGYAAKPLRISNLGADGNINNWAWFDRLTGEYSHVGFVSGYFASQGNAITHVIQRLEKEKSELHNQILAKEREITSLTLKLKNL